MRRTRLLVLAALLASGALVLHGCRGRGRAHGSPPRHLLLVTIAGLRADHVSILGYARDTTWFESGDPDRSGDRGLSFDDLAAQGVLFTRAFAASGDTDASLASLHLGRSPFGRTDPLSGALAEDERPLALYLQEQAGFTCAGFVARPRGHLGEGWGRGFAHLEQVATDDEALERAAAWVRAHDSSRPTFLWLHLAGPEHPFEPGRAFRAGAAVDCARLFADPESFGARGDVQGGQQAAAQQAHQVALYDGELVQTQLRLADFLGVYRAATEASGAWADTLLVCAGSNGQLLFEEGPEALGGTDSLAAGVLHVPLLMRHPRSLTGRRALDSIVELADLAPTLIEMLELDGDRFSEPSPTRERSLLAVLRTRDEVPARHAVALRSDGRRALVRGSEWRLEVEIADPGLEIVRLERPPARRDRAADEVAVADRLLDVLLARTGGAR